MKVESGTQMSEELRGFLHRASEDEAVKEKLAALQPAIGPDDGTTPSEGDYAAMAQQASELAQAEGFDVSPDELVALWEGAGSQELDDAELAQVAGGKDICACAGYGHGVFTDKFGNEHSRVCCVAMGMTQDKSSDKDEFFCFCFAAGCGEWQG